MIWWIPLLKTFGVIALVVGAIFMACYILAHSDLDYP